jgi:hypothetical protein
MCVQTVQCTFHLSSGSIQRFSILGIVTHACHLSSGEGNGRRITVQASPDIKRDPIPKITNEKRAGGMPEVVESLPSEHKAHS